MHWSNDAFLVLGTVAFVLPGCAMVLFPGWCLRKSRTVDSIEEKLRSVLLKLGIKARSRAEETVEYPEALSRRNLRIASLFVNGSMKTEGSHKECLGECAMEVRNTLFFVVLAAYLCFMSAPASADSIVIFKQGQPGSGLYVPGEQGKVLAFGIKDLQDHIRKSTGRSLPVRKDLTKPCLVVSAGKNLPTQFDAIGNELKDIGDEGFVIKNAGAHLVIAGNTELGTVYGIYAFLEKSFGVRWYLDCELGTVIPKKQDAVVEDVFIKETPSFRIRWVGSSTWALRNRMNVRLPWKDKGIVEKWGGHSFRSIIPPKVYFKDHPEFFAEIGGKRKVDMKARHGNQLCTSNPELIKEVVRRIIQAIDGDPNIDIVSLSPNDGGGFCECANCAALDEPGVTEEPEVVRMWNLSPTEKRLTRRLLTFYRTVAKEVKKKHPDVLIKSFVYASYTTPPKDKSIVLEDNQLIQFCHGACQNHSMNDPACPVNASFNRSLVEWRRISKHVMLYEYYHKTAWIGAPWAIVHTLARDIPYFAKLDLDGLYTQYGGRSECWTNGHLFFIAARLLWNPDTDVKGLMQEFCVNMYGKAAQPMKSYYENFENAFVASGEHVANQRPLASIERIFTPQVMKQAESFITQAERMADTREARLRVENVKISFGYISRLVAVSRKARHIATQHGMRWYGDPVPESATDEISELLNALHSYVRIHGRKRIFIAHTGYHDAMLGNAKRLLPLMGGGERRADAQGICLDKPRYLKQQKRAITKADHRDAKFDLWMYGNDWDTDGEKSEHIVSIRNRRGQWTEAGGLANLDDPKGNGVNRINIIRGISWESVPGDRIEVSLSNPSGGWTFSRLLAAYIMPHDPAVDNDTATSLLQKHIDLVRRASYGFVEFPYKGIRNNDGNVYGFMIQVTGRQAGVPEMPQL